MKLLKRITAFVLALVMLMAMAATADWIPEAKAAEANTLNTLNVVHVNPLYQDVISEEDLNKPDRSKLNADNRDDAYYYNAQSAAELIRDDLVARDETIIIDVYCETTQETYADDAKALLYEILGYAMAHTGNPSEGDYILWNSYGFNAQFTDLTMPEDILYMTITITMTYNTTAEQEAEVNAAVADVLDTLDVYNADDYTKLKAVYDYICTNVTYDNEHLSDSEYRTQYTAYAALIDGTAVCQGYALLLYRLALELGVDCRLISGTGRNQAHGWNIAQVDGLYYNLDSTWDAGSSEYDYFLVSTDNFENHTRDDTYETPEFHQAYPMATENYTYDGSSDTPVTAPATPKILSCYSKLQTSVKVTWELVDNVDGYEIWSTSTPLDEESWTRVKTINGNSTDRYTKQDLEEGTTYYFKVRSFILDENGERICSDFSEIDYMPAAVVWDAPYSNATFRIRLRWNEIDGAHGYQIWRLNQEGEWKIVKTLGDKGNELTDDQGATTAYSNTGLTSGENYTYKMRAFMITEDGRKVFGAYSDEFTVAAMPEAPVVFGLSIQEANAQLSWDPINGAAGYQIWMLEGEEWKIVKSITDGSTSYTKYDLTSGVAYQFKVRAYTEVDGKKTFGDYSESVIITVK